MGRLVLCALCLMVGCSETTGTVGSGGSAGTRGVGGVPECQGPEDCDDGNECTADVCVGGVCDHTPVEDDAECGGGRGACEASSCVGSFGCDEQGVRDAIALGGGPHTFFDCDNSVPVVTETEIVIDNDVILDGDGSLTVHGNEDHRVLSVAEGVSVSLKGLTVTGGFDGPGPKSLRNGAGIQNRGVLTLIDTTVSRNTIRWGDGGGIYNLGALTLINTTVSGNSAESPVSQGGGISNSGTLTLINSTISGNTAWFVDGCNGTSIFNSGTVAITSSTISGDAVSVCVIANVGTLTIANSVVQGDCGGSITSRGYNIESSGDTCGLSQTTDQVEVGVADLNLGPLAENAGLTHTHIPLTEPVVSAALDKIPAKECLDANGQPLTTDQRGEPRPETGGTMCDVGALELQTGECKGPADRQLIDTAAFEAEVRKCEGRIEPLCLMGFLSEGCAFCYSGWIDCDRDCRFEFSQCLSSDSACRNELMSCEEDCEASVMDCSGLPEAFPRSP